MPGEVEKVEEVDLAVARSLTDLAMQMSCLLTDSSQAGIQVIPI